MADDVFVDAESSSHHGKEENRYEDIVLSQISVCVKNLSREMKGGVNVIHYTKYGEKREYLEDVREVTINSIWTLKSLLLPFIASKEDQMEVLNQIDEEIDEKREELSEEEYLVRGRGKVKLKELGFIPPEHHAWKNYIEYKLQKYKEMFAQLVQFYNGNKDEIRKLSEE